VGTTDTEFAGDRNEPLATRNDIDYILAQANRVLEPQLKYDDIIGVYAGLRPLVSRKADASTTKLSREHTVDRPTAGFVSIAGGKYTTYRVMAEDVIDLAAKELRGEVKKSSTEKLPIVGADGYGALVQQVPLIARESGLSETTIVHLLNRYGSLISEILELIEREPTLAQPLASNLPYIRAEIHYAVSHEGARSVEDVIARRTRLAFEAVDGGDFLLEQIAEIISPLLKWDRSKKNESIKKYMLISEHERVSAEELLSVPEKINS
jgi:glycerol-3-phosphate dehydrogenase